MALAKGPTGFDEAIIINTSGPRGIQVRIGEIITLGVPNWADPDASQPNPVNIEWTRENVVVEHKIPGQRPLTECTIPLGLRKLTLKFNCLKGPDGGISENLKTVSTMPAGPYRIVEALYGHSIDGGVCMYYISMRIVQTDKTDDWYHTVEMTFLENNDGGIPPSPPDVPPRQFGNDDAYNQALADYEIALAAWEEANTLYNMALINNDTEGIPMPGPKPTPPERS